jgi:hypothetical protein
MMSRLTRALTAGATALGAGLLVTLPTAVSASASPGVPTFKPGHVLYDVGIHSDVTPAQAVRAAVAASTFTQYKATVKVGTTSYTYVIAGQNPAIKVTNPASTITTELIPLIMKFPDGRTWDPTKTDSCDSGASALTRTQNSPIYKSQSWTWGGTPIGTGQVTDAFQRAEFWKYAQPTGINPTFGINLTVTTLSPITINVPSTWGPAEAGISCGNGFLGAVNINHLDSYLQKTVIPSLSSKGVGPATVPVFLLHNFVEYTGSNPSTGCCVLGYHNAYNVTAGVQTYALAMYDNSRAFNGSSDVSALSHEVGEWQNDPYTNNPTPSWGHIGQVSGCQNNLEVGDPLSGTTFADAVGGFTYHPQELAFFSWFYHQSPSLGVNGWYSDQGKFRTFAANCA